ncbi:hypothetical protein J2Z48_001323 [Croceifilum oryzae]|uniref:Type I phosphodiesterase / nucleotide pyrophosphatase n=1 Tax=Croceifilum oryzae TaxID=1553429 RepID=A0AAJ1TM19_9BACL|nr:alkaline phosphatase family protein [Croceifilum oryzae]MDQ0417151.1 hypothetical protein [Croceifilum oryzae]
MLTIIFIIIGLILILTTLIRIAQKKRATLSAISKPEIPEGTKPVIMIIIDSLMDAPLQDTIHVDKAPALQFLIQNGTYYPRIVSSFPTMSVVIDSTLLTGSMPSQHGIYGLCYYDENTKQFWNFGTGAKESIAFGVKRVLTASMMMFNQRLLSKEVRTIHEEIPYDTASINAVVYRGNTEHQIHSPLFAWILGLLPRKVRTMAPTIFSFGSMHPISSRSEPGGAIARFGMNDRFTAMEMQSLIQTGRVPIYSVLYFPGNDDQVHQHGIATIKGIEKADSEIQTILNTFPTWEEAISRYTWIVLGDSGQTNTLPSSQSAYIHIDTTLSHYPIKPPNLDKPRESDQIVLAVNERMAYVHIIDPSLSKVDIATTLQSNPDLDLVVWKEENTYQVISGTLPGKLQFEKEGPYLDEYGQSWQISGDLSLLDITLSEDQTTIQYNAYPDPFYRLVSALHISENAIIVTATTGCEIVYGSSPTHKGASHGSLHHLDSLVPMIVAGTTESPRHNRIVDLKEWMIRLTKAN